MSKKQTSTVSAGGLLIGGGNRISVQTMWKRSLHNFTKDDLTEIKFLESIGCDILRFSAPDMKSSEVLGSIKNKLKIPIVADIHFDHKIALDCIARGIDKIRINPGNIGAQWKVHEVLSAASEKNIPIRIGINTGSLPKEYSALKDKSEAMLRAAEDEIEILEKAGFNQAVFSLKASNLEATIEANKVFSERYSYPLHLGVTEAGPQTAGIVKTSIAFYQLFEQGIGDTIRVSLTDTPAKEVIAGREILKACGKSDYGVTIVSCPRCGRSTFDTHKFIMDVSDELYLIKKPVKVAIMGCVVNGPGEALDADVGITGVGNKAVIFKQGKIIHKVDENIGRETFLKVLDDFIKGK
jgi:(E)-4-hydroxy-3-methylbut-2-enyl-diphosphate synthase